MNRIFIITSLVVFSFQACALKRTQERVILEKPEIDKRVELISIVFRLAGNWEYSSTSFQLYTDRIEQHFAEHRNHELIQFARSIRNERGIGFDAPMLLAVHLDDNLNLLADVSENVWQQDTRWTEEIVEKFVSLLQQFAKDTNFDDFFANNTDLYAKTIERFLPIYEQINIKWFFSFFGQEPSETFLIRLGVGNAIGYVPSNALLSNRAANYGPSVNFINGDRRVYAIMGVRGDDEGIPTFLEDIVLPIVIHEFAHSFVNHLIDKNIDALRESGEKIFSVVEDKMRRQAYGHWITMMCEALVRASVVMYLKDNDFAQEQIKTEINRQLELGYFWIEELIAKLVYYSKNRNRYPTLESFMPRIIEGYRVWAENIEAQQ